jgi:CheY-like chemotaxis protein
MQVTHFSLNQLISEVVDLYCSGSAAEIRLDLAAKLGEIEATAGGSGSCWPTWSAMRYTRWLVRAGRVEISTCTVGALASQVQLTISDNGRAFWGSVAARVRTLRHQQSLWHGPRSAIVKRIVEEHAGQTEAETRRPAARVSAYCCRWWLNDAASRAGASMNRILVVDDEADIRRLLQSSPKRATRSMSRPTAEAVRRGRRLPTRAGILDAGCRWHHLARMGRQSRRSCPVVMMSGHGTVETAVEATRLGAFDFVESRCRCQAADDRQPRWTRISRGGWAEWQR